MTDSRYKDICGITAASIERYFSLKGWVRDSGFINKNLMVFDAGKGRRIALPASERYEDFYPALSNLVQTIAVWEQRDRSRIVKDILSVCFDRLEFRIISDMSIDGKLPLRYAANCIEGLKELVLYSACAEQNAQPVCFKATDTAKSWLENFKLAQTEMGSFVINIDTRVAEDGMEQIGFADISQQVSYEHKIVERISTAINQVNGIVEHVQSIGEVTSTAYETGITANMCDALLKMKPDTGEAKIDTTIRFASALTQKLSEGKHVIITDHHFYVIGEFAKRYRDRVICQDVVMNGMVTSLSTKRGGETDTERTIKLHTVVNDQYRTITMVLSHEDYRTACDAHRDEREVEVAGELDMSGRLWTLANVKYLKTGGAIAR